MSSVFGHSLAAVTVYLATKSIAKPRPIIERLRHYLNRPRYFVWILWLIVVASIPDLDYLVEAWHPSNNEGLRITHSILFCLIVPSLTIVVLFFLEVKAKRLKLYSSQVILAGLSHLLLDLFVGVTPIPLLFPVVNLPIKLPFGILPSAGKIDLSNYYFYRNLKLEMGVLLPIFAFVCLWSDRGARAGGNARSIGSSKYLSIKIFISTLLFLCCGYFVRLNLALPR